MSILDLLLLIWNDRNSGGLGTIMVYLLPVSILLTGIIWAIEER